MRLIVEYTVGDGYTYCATVTVPVVHESPEAFIVEFEEKCSLAYSSDDGGEFTVGCQEFNAGDFYERTDFGEYVYFSPRIMTVDEFFETVEK